MRNQMLTDKFKTVNQTNKSAQMIFNKDNQIRATNFKILTNEDPKSSNDRTKSKWPDYNKVFNRQITLQIPNIKF